MVKVDASSPRAGGQAVRSDGRAHNRLTIRGRGLLVAGGLAVVLLAAGPLVFGSYLLNVLIQAFFFSIVAVTVDILWGYTGYLTFGQSAFFGLGAYAGTHYQVCL